MVIESDNNVSKNHVSLTFNKSKNLFLIFSKFYSLLGKQIDNREEIDLELKEDIKLMSLITLTMNNILLNNKLIQRKEYDNLNEKLYDYCIRNC